MVVLLIMTGTIAPDAPYVNSNMSRLSDRTNRVEVFNGNLLDFILPPLSSLL